MLGFLFTWAAAFSPGNSGDRRDQGDQQPYLVKEFTIDGAGVLKAFTVAGNIEVQQVSDTDRVRVELYIERGYAIWSDSRNLDNYRITILQRGNDVIASVEQKKKNTGFFSDKMNFSYKVYLPETMSTELKTLGGNVKLSGLIGEHMAKTSAGNIELTNLKGRIGAYTSSGNIDISQCKGIIMAQTQSGDIHLKGSAGEMRLKTSAGNIISTQTSGSFVARTARGDIRAQFTEVGEGISMETNLGNVYAGIPSGAGFDLFAAALYVELETGAFFGEKSPQEVDGRLNGGGTPLQLQAPAGTVTIEIKQ